MSILLISLSALSHRSSASWQGTFKKALSGFKEALGSNRQVRLCGNRALNVKCIRIYGSRIDAIEHKLFTPQTPSTLDHFTVTPEGHLINIYEPGKKTLSTPGIKIAKESNNCIILDISRFPAQINPFGPGLRMRLHPEKIEVYGSHKQQGSTEIINISLAQRYTVIKDQLTSASWKDYLLRRVKNISTRITDYRSKNECC